MFLKSGHSLGEGLMTACPAILSQRRAALDMGFALFQHVWIKEALQSEVFFYAMTDFSCRGFRDYEISFRT